MKSITRRGSIYLCLIVALGLAGCQPQSATPTPDASSSPSAASAFFDSSPRQLAANFGPGIGGSMACSSTQLVFTDGPIHVLYRTGLSAFQPRQLLTVKGTIGPISMAGSWSAFTVYTQVAGSVTPLASWSVYAVNTVSGAVVHLASGATQIELTEMPMPTVGSDFIVWDELMSGPRKLLFRYDLNSGSTKQLDLPAGMYPVRPYADGRKVMFLDNSRDANHASEVWLGRGGEPYLLDLDTGGLTDLAPGANVFDGVLTPSRAVWINGAASAATTYSIEEAPLGAGTRRTIADIANVAPLIANDAITIWLDGTRGAVTARTGGRTAVVSPDLTVSPGGMALCGSLLYYAGPDLSLRTARIG